MPTSVKLWLTVVLLSGSLAQATTYYISPSGSDSNPGSQPSPFQHISKGAAVANAGDTVIAMNGTYGSEGQCAHPGHAHGLGSVVVFPNSGNAAAGPITFMAQNRGTAILDGSIDVDNNNCGFTTGPYICQNAWSYFDLAQNSVAYITIDGFVIQNTCVNAFHANSSSSSMQNIVIRHNEIRYIGNTWDSVDDTSCGPSGCGANGILIPAGPSNFTFDGNIWHDIGHGPNTNQQHAIYSAASDSSIVNNIFYNLGYGYGVVDDSGSNVLIANNTFADDSSDPHDDGQIVLWDGYGPFSNITIENNIFYNPNHAGVSPYIMSPNDLAACAIDYNLTTASALLLDTDLPSNCSVGGHNQTSADPGLVSIDSPPPPYDFHLSNSASPAIGKGVVLSQVTDDCDGNTRPPGPAADIGACIFVGDYTTSLQGWWTFDETENDSSGNHYDGAGKGSPAPGYTTAIRPDTASISLNGETQYVSVPAPASNLNMTDNLTIAFWLNPSGSTIPGVSRKSLSSLAERGANSRTVAHSNSEVVAKNQDWDVNLSDGALQFSAQNAAYAAVTNSTIPERSWTHVAIIYASASSGIVSVYINGAPAALSTNNFPPGWQLGFGDFGLNLGVETGAQAGFLTGAIDDVRIYSRALSASDAEALYLATNH